MTLLAATSADYWPFVVLAVSVAFIILAISVLRVHAFIALVFAALLACLMAGNETWDVVQKDGKIKVMPGLVGAGENLLWMLAFLVVTAFVGLLGDKALATQSYFFQICLFILLFGLSIGLGNEIIIGHLAGARRFEQAYRQLIKSLKLGLIVTSLIAIAAALNGRAIISLFTDDADIITQVAQLFLISLILEPGRTFNLVVINALRATGDARFPLYMALVSMWGIAVPLAYFLGIMQGYGLVGIWLALACDEWVRGLAMFWRWRSRRWQNKILVET